MTTKPQTQLERVRGRLLKVGFITRNQCLSQVPAITRLAARIDDLKKEGFIFKEEDSGRDYTYHLVSQPFDLVAYFNSQPDYQPVKTTNV